MSAAMTPSTTVRHKIGKCPCCRGYVWADVTVYAEVSPPTLDDSGEAKVYARGVVDAVDIAHKCSREDQS